MLNDLLTKYILDPNNADYNYNLGIYYESIDQTASALSYFLRCAERSSSPEIQYECLLRASSCFQKQGKRNFTVKGLLQHAISILPKRPEAYYLLSRFYEGQTWDGSWHDSYMISSVGEKVANAECEPLRNPIDYPGLYGITFQKAVAAWWCGLCEESRDLFLELNKNPNLNETIREAVQNNITNLNIKEKNMDTNAYYHDTRPNEEWGIITTNKFKLKDQSDKRFFVIDNFYEDPMKVRELALSQTYFPGEGAVGHRTRKQFLFDGIKEKFEDIMQKKIIDHTPEGHGWKDMGINGRFQYCEAGTPLVYHCDSQQWAGMVYLTPDAPPCCGTSFFRHKKTKIYHNSQIDWDAGQGSEVFNQNTFVDRTPYEMVDSIGNVFNRLIIFDGGLIHSASEYFGWDISTSRLFHMFFFNT